MTKPAARTEFRLVKGSDVQVVHTPSQKVQLEYRGYVLEDATPVSKSVKNAADAQQK